MLASSAVVQSSQSKLGTVGVPRSIFLSHTWSSLQERRFGHSTKWAWLLPLFGSQMAQRWRRASTNVGHCRNVERFNSDRFRFPPSLLDQGRQSMDQALSYSDIVYVVRSYGRASSFRRMTCGVLEQLLPLNSCRLVLAAEDPDLDVYRSNSGPWENRFILGVKGAERQIAFIDQISPLGHSVAELFTACAEFVLHPVLQYECETRAI